MMLGNTADAVSAIDAKRKESRRLGGDTTKEVPAS